MSIVMEKMMHMSSERQHVKSELDNIIQRRKSMKNLATSNSFAQLSSGKHYPFGTPLRDSISNYINYQSDKQDKHLAGDRSYKDLSYDRFE